MDTQAAQAQLSRRDELANLPFVENRPRTNRKDAQQRIVSAGDSLNGAGFDIEDRKRAEEAALEQRGLEQTRIVREVRRWRDAGAGGGYLRRNRESEHGLQHLAACGFSADYV